MTVLAWALFVIGIPMLVMMALAFFLWIDEGELPPLRLPRPHRHDWTRWTEWLPSIYLLEVQWERRRRCRRCGKEGHQVAGNHRCADARINQPCTHRDQFATLLADTDVEALERELGFKDD